MQDVLRAVSEMSTEDLERVGKAINDRYRVLRTIRASVNLASVAVGGRVTLDGLSPKYINGSRGTVTRVAGTKVTVDLDDTFRESRARQKYGATLTVPASAVRVLEDA